MSKFLGACLFIGLICYFLMIVQIANAFTFKFKDVDPAFQGYTNEFYDIVHKNCPKKQEYEVNYYNIDFADSPSQDTWIGICIPSLNGFTIYIDRRFWKQYKSIDIRRELIFHELSHCVIYRAHSDNPFNYMYPSIRPDLASIDLNRQLVKNIQDYCNE